MSERIGIKTKDSKNRILARGELIVRGLEGLIADLGTGFFVVTKEAARELTKMGVEFEEVEIVRGRPPFPNQKVENYAE